MGSLMKQALATAPAAGLHRFLKMGLYGLQGTGKTTLGISMAIGLVKHFKLTKPIVMADTEKGSKFWATQVKKETGMDLVPLLTKNFDQMCGLGREAEQEGGVFIVDSATAFWQELCEAHRIRLGVRKLEPFQYAEPGGKWKREFTDWMLNANIHVIVCGRTGQTFAEQEDDNGRMKSQADGTRMKAQGDFGYEFDLLVEMQQHIVDRSGKRARSGSVKIQGLVLKDRWRDLNGSAFTLPTFKDFLPHIKNIAAEGDEGRVDIESRSEYVEEDAGRDRAKYARDRKIEIDLVKADLVKVHGEGRSTSDKSAKIDSLFKHWGTRSWEEINLRMPIGGIRAGRQSFELEHKLAPEGKTAAELFGQDDLPPDFTPGAGGDESSGDAAA